MWFFYQRWSVRSTRSIVKRVDILAVCTYNICDALPCQLSMSFDHGCSKCRNKPTLLCEKRIAKTQELWMNKCCHIALFFTLYCDVSFQLIVLIDVNCSLQRNPFSNQWLNFLFTLNCVCK